MPKKNWKYIYDDLSDEELYNLNEDEKEQNNMKSNIQILKNMRKIKDEHLKKIEMKSLSNKICKLKIEDEANVLL